MAAGRFWSLAHIEFIHLVEGFNWREEMKWKRTFRLWSIQLKDPGAVSFDEFMGRKPVLSDEEKFADLWEKIERDRQSAEPKVTEHASTSS